MVGGGWLRGDSGEALETDVKEKGTQESEETECAEGHHKHTHPA